MVDIPDIEKDPSIGISYNMQIGTGHSLVLQTFVARDGDKASLDAALDKLRVAAERQWAFAERERLKANLAQQQDQARVHAKRMALVDESIKLAWTKGNKRGDPVLSSKERQEQAQAYANAEEIQKRIATVKQSIADVEAIIGA